MVGIGAGVSPEDAQSNLAGWAEVFGLDWLANLITPTINDIILWSAVVAFVISIAWLLVPTSWKQITLGKRPMPAVTIYDKEKETKDIIKTPDKLTTRVFTPRTPMELMNLITTKTKRDAMHHKGA